MPNLMTLEFIFFFLTIIFGFVSTIVTFPLSNGDEGYHLSKCYNVFSSNHPESMNEEILRNFEMQAITRNSDLVTVLDIKSFNSNVLDDVKNDGIKFNLLDDENSIVKKDIAHLPAAIGVLLARLVYPSYGFMLFFARIFNSIFFSIFMAMIIKFSKIGKWSLFMLFSIPFMQKIASPSYDVYSYIVFAMFVINLLNLAKLKSLKELNSYKIYFTILTVILLLFAKNNYIFAFLGFCFLPMIIIPINNYFKKLKKIYKIIFILLTFFIILIMIFIFNNIFDLKQFIKLFFDNYLNMASAGRRGKELFNIVPAILPDMINILWILLLFVVMISEQKHLWNKETTIGMASIFFVNWIGIYAGFYMIFNIPTDSFDDLSGRYLHPFLVFFLPCLQNIGAKCEIKISKRSIRKIAVISTIFIFVIYLITVYYRGYIISATPTWNT